VDEAAVLGRLAMRAVASGDKAQVRDWAAPVLYLRAPGGRIFNPVQEAHTARAAEQASAQLFSQQVGRIGPPGRLIGPVVGTMSSGDVEVVQRIKEDVQGFVLGARVFNFQGGQLTVRQEAQDVTGSLTAAVIDNIGGGWVSPQTGSTPNPVEELQKLLRVV